MFSRPEYHADIEFASGMVIRLDINSGSLLIDGGDGVILHYTMIGDSNMDRVRAEFERLIERLVQSHQRNIHNSVRLHKKVQNRMTFTSCLWYDEVRRFCAFLFSSQFLPSEIAQATAACFGKEGELGEIAETK